MRTFGWIAAEQKAPPPVHVHTVTGVYRDPRNHARVLVCHCGISIIRYKIDDHNYDPLPAGWDESS